MNHDRSSTVTDESSTTQSEADAAQRFSRALDEWRGRIDGLVVQADLAQLDIRDEVRRRLETTENAYLAVRSRLSDANDDVKSNAGGLRQAVEQLLSDLRRAYEDADAAIKRGRKAQEFAG
jgi:hypothetical protein